MPQPLDQPTTKTSAHALILSPFILFLFIFAKRKSISPASNSLGLRDKRTYQVLPFVEYLSSLQQVVLLFKTFIVGWNLPFIAFQYTAT
jgi:hypothetical protein